MTRRLQASYAGNWLLIDWPFARLLSFDGCKDGEFKVSFYDVDCEVAERIMPLSGAVCVSARPFEVIRARFRRSGDLCMRVRYPSSPVVVEYVFHVPQEGRMRAECSWPEEFVNCNAHTSQKSDVRIVGKWRYALVEYSSLVMSVSRDGSGGLRLEVTDSTDNRRIRSSVDHISDSEVSFRLLESGIRYRLRAHNRSNAVCYCLKSSQVWVRLSSEVSMSTNG